MKKIALMSAALACVIALPATSQEMPPPRKMPRVPVSRQVIQHDAAPTSRQVQGLASIIDGEKLRIGDTDLRLFGIVPPQLAASYGPQARSALDQIASGQPVSCTIRDRDRDGRLLATCHTSNGTDMALELLKRGLAVTARGSIANTDLAPGYLSAELAAQNQKIGLWSSAVPVASAAPSKTEAPAPAPQETKPAAKAETSQATIAADVAAQQAEARIDDAHWATEEIGFLERYQMLISALLALGTALIVIGSIFSRDKKRQIAENKSLGAALRGELMAARSICIGRIKSIGSDEEDRAASWPRIRATLYQAYVGRLGTLGADLARQVSSIYGQASDYAAFYSPMGAAQDTPKRQALETLVGHIEDVLPRLAAIEQTGIMPRFAAHVTPRSRYERPAAAPALAPVYRSAPQPAPRPQPVVAPEALYESAAVVEEESQPAQTYVAPLPQSTASTAPVQSAMGAWEAVRSFIQNHSPVSRPAPAPQQDPMTDYAAMIEADMARYPYAHEEDTRASQKKSG